jgi:holo-[acyl-carrier protein] synthase
VIKGIGLDIVQIDRIESALTRTDGFAARILNDREQQEFSVSKQPARFIAKRFAVKEAVSKALGTGIGRGVSFQDIELMKRETGQPYIELSGGAQEISDKLGISDWFISYSDEQNYVVAQAIGEGH